MISSPNIVGLRTSIAASRMTCSRGVRPWSWASREMQFSIMITELSTIRPKSMAPRLMRLAVIEKACIRLVAKSIDRGMASAVTSPARRLPSMISSTMMTRAPPSTRFLTTVERVRPMRAERS